MIRKLLIANRGEVALRVISSCLKLGIGTVAVFSEADRGALHVRAADEAVLLGPGPAAESYLKMEAVLEAAWRTGADAVHPGYGFLSENSEFARRVEQAGLNFVGPPSHIIETMGSKVAARQLCQKLGIPTVPGSAAQEDQALLSWADQHGYPVMLKASAGGGGKGMRRLADRAALEAALPSARREAEKAFGSDQLYLERALSKARHLEVQIVGDRHGSVLHLGVRECSLQRRHQKLIEECPAPNVSPHMMDALTEAALRLAREMGYSSLGTVEFLVSGSEFYFLEMNTRLQVEHPVTEAVLGLDLVELQLAIAEGQPLPFPQQSVVVRGHAIEARIACEDPYEGFLPATGKVLLWQPSSRARVDSALESGALITSYYDSMVAKLICWGETREGALRRLGASLRETVLLGVASNLDFLATLLEHPTVVAAQQHIELVEGLPWEAPTSNLHQLLAAAASRRSIEAVLPGEHGLPSLPWQLLFEGQPVITVHNDIYTVAGVSYRVNLSEGAVEVDGHRLSALVVSDGERWWVRTPEGSASFLALPRHPVPRIASSGGSLNSPMPGSVVELMVALGDTVRADQPLLKLEAMKMEHIICAPADGVVESLPYAVGDQVEAGAALLRLSPLDESAS